MTNSPEPANGVAGRPSAWCRLLGHRFYWLDVKHRHHCRRCGATDLKYVLQSRRIRQINPRFGCDCLECAPRPALHDLDDVIAELGIEEDCHCGSVVVYGYDGNPTHHRGMCESCDTHRCDVDPLNAPCASLRRAVTSPERNNQ